jgi:cell division initiation protein
MKIGPVDIRNHTFPVKMRGLDEGQVRAFLDLIADRLEELLEENRNAEDSIAALRAQLEEYRGLEKSLRDSLLSAERATEERLDHAEREARLIVKNAEVHVDRMLADANERIASARAELEDLRRQRVSYVERFRALLRSQSRILEASMEDFGESPETAGELLETIRKSSRGGVASPPPLPKTHSPADLVISAGEPARPAGEHAEELEPAAEPGNRYLGEEGLFSRQRGTESPDSGSGD